MGSEYQLVSEKQCITMPRSGHVCVEREKSTDKPFFFLQEEQNITEQQILENAQEAQQLMYVCLCKIQS